MSLNKNVKSQDEQGPSNQDSSSRSRLLLLLLSIFILAMCLYLWDAEEVGSEFSELTVHKPQTGATSSLRTPTLPTASPAGLGASDASKNTAEPPISEGKDTSSSIDDADVISSDASKNTAEIPSEGQDTSSSSEVVASDAPTTTEAPISEEQDTPSSSGGGGDFDTSCSDICTKREVNRKEKFGGDFLDFQEIVRLAEAAHQKVQSTLRDDYGEYFDNIFVNGTNQDGGTHYRGMRPPGDDSDGSPSRERMKRKMKLKVLKMMSAVKATESNVHGCDCAGKTGSADSSEADEDLLTMIPEFYEKYVFANGGHSNAAGHGNMFSETYSAVFGRDVGPVWKAIGIEMIARNYAMGAMK